MWDKYKDGTYIVTRDEFKSIGTHWIALLLMVNNGSASYDAALQLNIFQKKQKSSWEIKIS